VLWRWHAGEHVVLSPADRDGARLASMVKAAQRAIHHMHAFLRFRERAAGAEPRFVAWFEPEHDILALAAPHFVGRMGQASWLIATPQGSAAHDGAALHFGPARLRHMVGDDDDDGEALWLTYYRSICNPARLNAGAMEMHMPVRYWKNLPEAPLIPGLVSAAAAGARRVAQAGAVGQRDGARVHIDAVRAQPPRALPSSLDQCRNCGLWRHATQAVAGSGPQQARLMVVGEQPGDAEDIAGVPFVGPAGRLLEDVMREAGVERAAAWMTNAVKHFKWEPRGKRRIHKTPAQAEVDACGHWLRAEMDAVAPEVIITLGATATRAVLGGGLPPLSELQGRALRHEGRLVIPTWHPAYVLRLPAPEQQAAARAALLAALLLAKEVFDERKYGMKNYSADMIMAYAPHHF
jgi:DNA polymerase